MYYVFVFHDNTYSNAVYRSEWVMNMMVNQFKSMPNVTRITVRNSDTNTITEYTRP